MNRQKFFRYAVTGYNAVVSLLLFYVIATSLAFTCEYLFGSIPDGAGLVFAAVGFVFALKLFYSRMLDMRRISDRLSLESNKDILYVLGIMVCGLIFLLALAWAWIKIYPHL